MPSTSQSATRVKSWGFIGVPGLLQPFSYFW